MREVEFLPDWYPRFQRRRRWVMLQVWLGMILVAGISVSIYLSDRSRQASRAALAALAEQVRQADSQLKEMDRLAELTRQWDQQDQILRQLGTHVESSRVLERLAQVMPSNMALLKMDLKVEETGAAPSALAAAAKEAVERSVQRWLKVELEGVAPTDVDLATFVTELNRVPYFDRISMNFARDLRQKGHVMRHFKLIFSVNLGAAVIRR